MLISAYVDNSLQIAKIFIVAHTKVCASVDLFVFLLLFCPRLYALLLFLRAKTVAVMVVDNTDGFVL